MGVAQAFLYVPLKEVVTMLSACCRVCISGLFFALALFSALFPSVSQAVDWVAIGLNPNVSVQASGDVMTKSGASLRVSSSVPIDKGGAIASVSAIQFRNRRVSISGELSVTGDVTRAGLWLRVDGEEKALVFRTTEAPFVADDGVVKRSLSAHVPVNATRIVFGVILAGRGSAVVESLSLSDEHEAERPPQFGSLVEEVLQIAEANALYSERVDWAAWREEARSVEQSEIDVRNFISRLLVSIGDSHSHFVPGESSNGEKLWNHSVLGVEFLDDLGYFKLPSTFGYAANELALYTESVCKELASGSSRATRGWIVDLRANGGGNMWPMLQALKPFLGSEPAGFFVDRSGASTPWEIFNSIGCELELGDVAVAVLVDSSTASAAEAVALAFRKRALSRIFGARTAGLANANTSFTLSDGSTLALTTAYYADREGIILHESVIVPDVAIDDKKGVGGDEVRNAAADWLRSLDGQVTTP